MGKKKKDLSSEARRAKEGKLLEEKKELNAVEIHKKIRRLEGYIKKTEMRIDRHEKALTRLRTQMKKEIQKAVGRVIKGKVYG